MKKTHRTAAAAQATGVLGSPVGFLHLAATDEGLTHVLFRHEVDYEPTVDATRGEAARILLETIRQLEQYFSGERREFELPLTPSGTEFQRATWEALRGIPFGATISYGELARRLGRPRAVRAVGAANSANPISIIVPCHRVIGADGDLTGYGGGLDIKRKLLAHEGVKLPEPRDTSAQRSLWGRGQVLA